MSNLIPLNCRYCQHYQPEGRRGGHCQRLAASVQGDWQSCSLAIPSFTADTAAINSAISTFVAEPEFFSYVSPAIAFNLDRSPELESISELSRSFGS